MKATDFLARSASAAVSALLCCGAMSARDYSSWMSELPDNAFVSTLSIPGSHDTATGEGFTSSIYVGSAQTQDKTVQEQMEMGVRAFDIRPGVYGNALHCYHGIARTKVSVADVFDRMTAFLDANPSEFFVIHLFPGNNAGGNDIKDKMNALLASDKYAPYMAEFRPNLLVRDMRGKIVFVRRWDFAEWNSEHAAVVYDWNASDNNSYSYPNGRITAAYDGWEAWLAVQDVAQTNTTDKKNAKYAAMDALMDYSAAMSVPDRTTLTWVFNFLSAYTGSTSSNSGYAENASVTNARMLSRLESEDYRPGPLGIVMADWVGGSVREFGTLNKKRYDTKGQALVEAIVENNFRYINDITPDVAAPLFRVNGGQAFSSVGYRGNVEWVDVDNDGWLDLVHKHRNTADGWNTEINLYKNNGGELDSRIALPDVDGCSWNRIVVPVEYDRDGRMDLVLGASWGSKLLHNNSGSFAHNDNFTLWGSELSMEDGDIERHSQGVMLAADFDMNGRQEILTYANDGFPLLFKNEGGTFYGGDSGWLPRMKDGAMAIGDYNADGMPDILVSGLNPDTNSRELWLCINTASGEHRYSFANRQLTSLAPYATTSGVIGFADVNNDGLLDIFLTGTTDSADKSMTLLLNLGNDTFAPSECANGFPAIKASGMDVCDLNGDGFADIVYSGECDRERFNWAATGVLMNQGDGTFVNYDYDFIQVRSGASCRASDYRRNGRPSIALMGYGAGGFGLYDQIAGESDGTMAMAAADDYVGAFRSFHDRYLKVDVAINPVTGTEADNTTVLSWNQVSPGLRYNYVVRLKDGSLVSAVPCDPSDEVRALLSGNVDAATAATSVKLNVNRNDVVSWGVHAVAPDKTSSLVYLDNDLIHTGIMSPEAGAESSCEPVYYNLQGMRVAHPSGGIFIEVRGGVAVKRHIP